MSRLQGLAALVSGGAGDIGGAIARALEAEGAGVLVGDLRAPEAEQHLRFQHLDVSSESDWTAAVAAAEEAFGGLDILVNAAGVAARGRLDEASREEWEQALKVNATGAWLGMRACLPALRRRGGGSIVNVASTYALVGSPTSTAYHASKGALRALTRAAAVELAPEGIRVNAVYPGIIRTRMTASLPQEGWRRIVGATPLGRAGKAEEVAAAVLFLASPDSSYVTGAELTVDGGYTAA